MVLGARDAGFTQLLVPHSNAAEAALLEGTELYPIDSLQNAVAVLLGHGAKFRTLTQAPLVEMDEAVHGDFADVRGQNAKQNVVISRSTPCDERCYLVF